MKSAKLRSALDLIAVADASANRLSGGRTPSALGTALTTTSVPILLAGRRVCGRAVYMHQRTSLRAHALRLAPRGLCYPRGMDRETIKQYLDQTEKHLATSDKLVED